MNKIAIPALLVATIMVAGIFAFAPVEQASTVHTTTSSGLITEVETSIILDDGSANTHTITYTFNDDSIVYSMQIELGTTEITDNFDVDVITVNGVALNEDTGFSDPGADTDIDQQWLRQVATESVPLAIQSGNTITIEIQEDDTTNGATDETLTVTFVYASNFGATITASSVAVTA